MPSLFWHRSTSKVPALQKPEQSDANSRSSIPAKDAKANGAHGSFAESVAQVCFPSARKRQEYENAASMFYPEWLTSTPPGSEEFPERMPETPGGRHGLCARNQ